MEVHRPRLLVLASTFPRWQGDTEPRFIEALCYELAKSFRVIVLAPHCEGALRQEKFVQDGHSIDVCRFRYGPDSLETLAYEGGMLFRLRRNPLRMLMLPFFIASQGLAASRLQREHDFDAVHAHWIVPHGFVAAILSRLPGRFPPVLVTSHGSDLYALRGAVFERLKRWILARVNAVTVVSRAMRDYCEEHSLARGKIIVQSMGVDLESKFTPGETPDNRAGLIFVGRLVEKKGVEYVIQALAVLADRHAQLKLTIVGDGPSRENLSRLASNHGLSDRVCFVGSVRNEEVPDYLRSAAISIMPSCDLEGLGLVVVEAQGCGCAVVASDLPAVRDTIVNGQTGLLAEPANPADLADKIARLLDDDSLRQRLAESGRRHALEKFTWTIVGRRYAEIIKAMFKDS